MLTKLKNLSPNQAAAIGFLFFLPFFITNLAVVKGIQPFYSWLESIPTLRNNPIFPLFLICLFLIGAAISLLPIFKSKTKKFYLLNILVAAFLLLAFVVLAYFFGQEFYRCEVLQIRNCD